MVADAVKARNRAGGAEAIANTLTREPISFREGTEADDVRHVGQSLDRGQGVFGREFAVGFIKHQQSGLRQGLCELDDGFRPVPASHRVVRVGEIDERRIFALHGFKQRLHILAIVTIGHGHEPAAEAGNMVVEGGISAERGNDRRIVADDQTHHEPQKPVDTFADNEAIRRQTDPAGERLPQIMVLGIGIAPGERCRFAHGLDHRGRRTEAVFVRTETGAECRSHHAFLRLRTDEGNGRRQRFRKICKAAKGIHGLGLPGTLCAKRP